MIAESNGVFRLAARGCSYIFRVTAFSHLEHIYFGPRLADDEDITGLVFKRGVQLGATVAYDSSDPTYSLDVLPLEWSGIGRGDFRFSPAELKMPDGSFVSDFQYLSHRIYHGCAPEGALPTAYGDSGCDTLDVELSDRAADAALTLRYTVFEDCGVITRRAILKNNAENPLVIRRLMSMCLDLPDRDYRMVTLDGSWIKEACRHERPVQYGMYVNSSATGASSNRHNPAFLLCTPDADERRGEVYGFNLIYSGNHFSAVERSERDVLRVVSGINPHCFEWTLHSGESFETPESAITYSQDGFGGMSRNFHDFVNEHIVRGEWKGKERPVLLNDWEACFFDFTGRKLTRLAKRAKQLGVELFVLDDGWFKGRNSDTAGLGDYEVDTKKLPGGLGRFGRGINKLGLSFGLWFEPEMVNPDSDLFRAHPEYALRIKGREPTLGRNQLVLDLCRADVRDYIVENVGRVLDSAPISYVKWDMNRHISEFFSAALPEQGRFFHSYILGLYDLLRRIFGPRPNILFESCSSGGNRFDLGMLCFSPQIWTSDNTDPVDRESIQDGISLFYPLSTMGAHVSMAPHAQSLRDTPLSTRFNVSAFGCLGYELDLSLLSRVELREIKEQIAFYKAHRRAFQYGRFSRIDDPKPNKRRWQVTAPDGKEAVAGFFQTLATPAEGYDRLVFEDLEPDARYRVTSHRQSLYIRRFGWLTKHLTPVPLKPDGFILRTANKFFALSDCAEEYTASGRLLSFGLRLACQFMGSGFNDKVRALSDYGSTLYLAQRLPDEDK